MKNKDLKKGKESIIGKIIYVFLLFMPLIAIGVTCVTNFFNKEDSLITKNKYETNEVNNANDLIIGNIYKVSYENNFDSITNMGVYKTIYNLNIFSVYKLDVDSYNIRYFRIRANSTILYIMDEDYRVISSYALTNVNNPIEFNGVIVSADENSFSGYQHLSYSNFNITQNILEKPREEVFYRAVDKVEQSNLFNWSKTTIIYTGIQNTCTQLGITNTFTPMLLAYWLLISVVYILYDIILMILIILHNRVHRLQDSMS